MAQRELARCPLNRVPHGWCGDKVKGENPSSTLSSGNLIIRPVDYLFSGAEKLEGLSPFTVLTISGFTSRALSELLLFENDNVLDSLAFDVLPGLSSSHGFAIG